MATMLQTPSRFCKRRSLAKLSAALTVVLGLMGHVDAQGASPDSPEASPVATGPGSVVRETHGAWQVSCRTPPGAKEEKCALVQSVTA
jgi:invasion protein IalB